MCCTSTVTLYSPSSKRELTPTKLQLKIQNSVEQEQSLKQEKVFFFLPPVFFTEVIKILQHGRDQSVKATIHSSVLNELSHRLQTVEIWGLFLV